MYAVLAAPMIVSFDLSTLNSPKQAFAKSMLMNKEMIAINQVRMIGAIPNFELDPCDPSGCCGNAILQDKDVVMASKVYTHGRNSWMTDVRT